MPGANDLVGVWRLVAFEATDADGNVTRPYGDAPEGRIVYTSGGIMSAHLGAGGRPPFIELGDTTEQRALAALRGHFSYSGRWRLEGDKVIHSVDMSVSPDWVGTERPRTVTLDGDEIVLTDEALEGRLGRPTGVGRLRWRREE